MSNFREDAAPYYNDFETNGKKYHKILFVPGRAIQSRELTQIQDIMYEQQRLHTTKTIEPGVVVSGCIPNVIHRVSIVLTNHDLTSDIDTIPVYVPTSDGMLVTDSADVKFKIYQVLSPKETKRWYPTEDKVIIIGEYLSSARLASTNTVTMGNGRFSISQLSNSTHITIDRGVVYAEKYFIEQDSIIQLILHPVDAVVNYVIGFNLNKTDISYLEDRSLLDRSVGFSSTNSPGANRLQITLEYTFFNVDTVDSNGNSTTTGSSSGSSHTVANSSTEDRISDGFHKVIDIKGGSLTVVNTSKPDFTDVYKRIAENTYETNGNFYVTPYKFEVKEHLRETNADGCGEYLAPDGNKDKFILKISPGEAYIYGWNVEHTVTTSLVFDKTFAPNANGVQSDLASRDDVTIRTKMGNYFICNQVAGNFFTIGETVYLYRQKIGAWDSAAYGNAAARYDNPIIGTARFLGLNYLQGYQGTPTCEYEVHISDIIFNSGATSMDVGAVRIGSGANQGFGDVITMINPKTENVKLIDKDISALYYPLPNNAIKTVSDLDLTAWSSLTVTRGNAGFQVSLSNPKYTFPYGLGKLNRVEIDESLKFIAEDGRFYDISTANLIDEVTLQFNIDEASVLRGTFMYQHKINGATARRKNLRKNMIVKLSTCGNPRTGTDTCTGSLSDIFRVKYNETVYADYTNQYGGVPTSTRNSYLWDGVTLKLGVTDVVKVSAVYIGSEYGTTGTNMIGEFIWDSGQTQTMYGYGTIQKKPTSSVNMHNKKITVVLDYYEDDMSFPNDGYYSVDSYINGGNRLCEIGYFGGKHLRDCIDFRLKLNSAPLTDSVNTTVELKNVDFHKSYNQLEKRTTYIVSLGNMNINYDYYLPRIDIVQLSKDGIFSVKKGIPNITPIPQVVDSDNIVVTELKIPPYMSYAPCASCNDINYQIKLNVKSYKRYTMRNIQGLDDRLKAVEYYVSLSLLETQTEQMKILDPNGLDRFKNGFLVDDFSSLTICDFSNSSTNCSIDKNKRQLRPGYTIKHYDVTLDNTSDVKVS
jgi:hypothetical protein